MNYENELGIVNRHLSKAPVNVRDIIRELGVEYVEAPMPPDASGRIEAVDDGFRIIVNSNQSNARRRFTAAHELAHYLLHRDLITERGHLDRLFSPLLARPTSSLSERHEVEANRMAAQILMPRAAIEDSLVWKHYDLDEVARDLQVSREALDIRLKTLRLDVDEFRRKWERDRNLHDERRAEALEQDF